MPSRPVRAEAARVDSLVLALLSPIRPEGPGHEHRGPLYPPTSGQSTPDTESGRPGSGPASEIIYNGGSALRIRAALLVAPEDLPEGGEVVRSQFIAAWSSPRRRPRSPASHEEVL